MEAHEQERHEERIGFAAKIRRSLTESPTLGGVPKPLFIFWLFLTVLAWAVIPQLFPVGFRWHLGLTLLFFAVGVVSMRWLTQVEPQWPQILAKLLGETDYADG